MIKLLFKVENGRFKAEHEQYATFKAETEQRVEILSNALRMFKDHIVDIDERVNSCNDDFFNNNRMFDGH